jgi:hypothetical protein
VLVTHDAELAAMADTRLVLRDGRVTENTLILRHAQDERPDAESARTGQPLVLSPSKHEPAR